MSKCTERFGVTVGKLYEAFYKSRLEKHKEYKKAMVDSKWYFYFCHLSKYWIDLILMMNVYWPLVYRQMLKINLKRLSFSR